MNRNNWTPDQTAALIGWPSGEERTITHPSTKKMYDTFCKRYVAKLVKEEGKAKTYKRI